MAHEAVVELQAQLRNRSRRADRRVVDAQGAAARLIACVLPNRCRKQGSGGEGMATAERLRAEAARSDLETDWVVLLSWLCRECGVTPEELLHEWNPPQSAKIVRRFQGEAGRLAPDSGVSLFQYLNFGDYAALAIRYRSEMQRLGVPPQRWTATLSDLNSSGVPYRNMLAHGERFDRLDRRERDRAVEMFQQTRNFIRSWWPRCPWPDTSAPVDNPLRTALYSFQGKEGDVGLLVDALGLTFLPETQNLVGQNQTSQLSEALRGTVNRLFRVGETSAGTATVAIYLVYPEQWEERSSAREKLRRTVARAIQTY